MYVKCMQYTDNLYNIYIYIKFHDRMSSKICIYDKMALFSDYIYI